MSTDISSPAAPEISPREEPVTTGSWEYLSDGTGATSVDNPEPSATLLDEKSNLNIDNNPTTSSTAYALSCVKGPNSPNSQSDLSAKKESTTVAMIASSNSIDEDKNDDSIYECNICLETAKDAVVSMCGHLFCWPCLHQWLETRPNTKLCPVCKAAISKEKVIPLYGRNSTKQEDPRIKVPPRPAVQLIEPEPQLAFNGIGLGDGFHMSIGINAFPFGYFASTFNIGEQRVGATNREEEQQLTLFQIFMNLALMGIVWLIFS